MRFLTSFDVSQLIFAAVAAWIGIGLVAGSLAFAYVQRAREVFAADDYKRHVKFFWIGVALEPIGLLHATIQLLFGNWEYHGLLFPSQSAFEEARELQRRARPTSESS